MVAERGVWLQERTPEKTCEQVVDFRVRQVVEQVLAVPKNSSQDRNLQGTVEQIPDDPMLGKAEQLEEVPETVSRDGVQQRTVEQIVGAPVPQGCGGIVRSLQGFLSGQDSTAHCWADHSTHVQHVANAVEVEKPKIIELTVQRKKPHHPGEDRPGDQAR